MVNELSIFFDESGDFGEYRFHAPYYIISAVFHDQRKNIQEDIVNLDKYLSNYTSCNWIHTGPIVRSEEIYRDMNITDRRKILARFSGFARKCPITYKSFYIKKRQFNDNDAMVARLTRDLTSFLQANFEYFSSFDLIKVYYDNGQSEVTKMLTNVFNDLFADVVFTKAVPSEYKLFQAADLFCYFTLIKLKLDSGILSENEIKFFGTKYALRKNYLKPLAKMEFGYVGN